MFCRKCGTELADEAVFCTQCGTKIISQDEIAQARLAAAGETVPLGSHAHASDATAEDGPSSRRRRGRRGLIAGVALAVLVVAVGAGAGALWWKSDQDARAAAQAEWDAAHATAVTLIELVTPGFDEGATAIPVQVRGTDLDGNAVDEVQYLRPGSMGVSTRQGSYDLSFPAGYITGDGQVARAPGGTRHIDVDFGGDSSPSPKRPYEPGSSSGSSGSSDTGSGGSSDSSAGGSGSSSPSNSAGSGGSSGSGSGPAGAGFGDLIFEIVPDIEVDDGLLDEIARYAGLDPEQPGKADGLVSKARERRDKAVAEEEARKAEEARVQERKDAIEATARAYIDAAFDHFEPDMNTIRHERDFRDFYSPNANMNNGWGWLGSSLISLDSFEVVDENTVSFSVTFKYGPYGGRTPAYPTTESQVLTFDENALILTGGIGMRG